jgi:hypothetical protein
MDLSSSMSSAREEFLNGKNYWKMNDLQILLMGLQMASCHGLI